MKLLRLKITDPKGFRSLQPGFEYRFRHPTTAQDETCFAPFVCAGPNGSGKSNVLEVLAAIFYHLECMRLDDDLPDTFTYNEQTNPNGFHPSRGYPDAFELEMMTKVDQPIWQVTDNKGRAHILIRKCTKRSPEFFLMNARGGSEEQGIEFDRNSATVILPEHIVAYSSGENQILSLPFFKMRFFQYDEYWKAVTRGLQYKGQPALLYLDSAFSQAVLIANLLYGQSRGLEVFRSEVGIECLKEFRIIIKRRISIPLEKIYEFDSGDVGPEGGIENILKTHPALRDNHFVEGKESYLADIILPINEDSQDHKDSNVGSIITRLKSYATCWYEDVDSDQIYLDYYVNDATCKAFAANFSFDINKSPITLFHALQTLLTLNLYSVSDTLKADLYQSDSHYVSETIPTLASDERVMRFKFVKFKKTGIEEPVMLKALSDGEHQLLHSLGLCMLFKDTDSLFLLDEPETHFNPLWRSQFISHLKKCLAPIETRFTAGISRCGEPLASYHCPSEMLITTHTPFLISDSQPDKVLVFKKEEGKISVSNPEYNTFGASINKITMLTFGQKDTIGGQAASIVQEIKKDFQAEKSPEQLLERLDEKIGDCVEKTILYKTILDSMEQ